MIKFSRTGTRINVAIDTGTGHTITTQYECASDLYCLLLTQKLQEQLWQQIEAIRQDAYNTGWKEAKSKKRAKRDWFSGSIDTKTIL